MSAIAGVVPNINHEEKPFWEFAAAGRLVVPRCRSCDTHIFPPRAVCVECGSQNLEWTDVALPGRVYSFTVNYNAWDPEVGVPYMLAIVDFPRASNIRMVGLYIGNEAPVMEQEVGISFEEGPGGLTRPVFTAWSQS